MCIRDSDIPQATGWFLIALVLTILGGIVVYGFSHRILISVIGVGVFLAIFGVMGMIPLWIVFVIILFLIASIVIGFRL